MAPSIQDVAREAGVGVATVSRALNNRYGVKPATKERIEEIARRLGYTINPLVASLAGKGFGDMKQLGIAILTRCRINPGIQSLLNEAKAHNCFVEHYDTFQWQDAGHLSRVLHSRGFAAIIVHRVMESPDYFQNFDWRHFVAVRTDPAFLYPPLPLVRSLDTSALWTGLNKIQEKGFRRIGIILPDWRSERIEIVRLFGMALAFQDMRLCKADHIPPLPLGFSDAEENRAKIENWVNDQEPEVILAQYPFYSQLLEMKARGGPPFALIGRENPAAGMRPVASSDKELFALIDRLIRSRSFGLLPNPMDVIIHSVWHDGPELEI